MNYLFSGVLQFYINQDGIIDEVPEVNAQQVQPTLKLAQNKKRILDEDDEDEFVPLLPKTEGLRPASENQNLQASEPGCSDAQNKNHFDKFQDENEPTDKPSESRKVQKASILNQAYKKYDFEMDLSYSIRKKQIKIWGIINDKLKRLWEAYEVDNATNLFMKTYVFQNVI